MTTKQLNNRSRTSVRAHDNDQGFTIVELMMAMAFVAILLIAVATLTITISRTYTRGVTYKELNQAGPEVSDDIRRSFTASKVTDIKFVNTTTHNRLCLGKYSYIWNEPTDTDPAATKYGPSGSTPARLLKVTDPSGRYCTTPYPNTVATTDEVRELLAEEGNRDLDVYKITVSPLTAPNPQGLQTAAAGDLAIQRGLYTIKVTLGTGEAADIDVANEQCNPQSGAKGVDEYCAINTFTTVVSMGNTYTP